MHRIALLLVAAAAAMGHGTTAMAAEAKARVFIISESNGYAAPNWNWLNQSTAGILISSIEFSGGPPIDFIYRINTDEFNTIYNPVGGTRTLVRGEERGSDGNNGCTNGVAYNLTSFDPGDSFRFSVDPESGGCGSAVIDYRPSLRNDLVTAKVTFSNGIMLEGNNWTEELINPQGSNVGTNQRFFIDFSQTIAEPPPPVSAVPEPASWAMLVAGFGLVGSTLRRRRLASKRVCA